ncbi:serine/threonine-protein kinase 11-interacting protein isoform X1 [Synchiropus splendidus]|uniref:serine/threonine-protein kinase 11-interacting protein isoform X1 n=1 Tax=Synchiropus splendidus TaxID=270530 RepID=UPI00237D68CA|nr:serine/threonine-protein kinase 11-interacting protein isoform X1 [Synchiropus splendidus]
MGDSNCGRSSLVNSLATLLRNDGDLVLDGRSTLTLHATSLQQLVGLFEQHLQSRNQLHGFLALPSHPADTSYLLQLQFLFDILQKTVSLKLINPPGVKLQSVVKIFPFKSLKYLELKRIPAHCLEGLRVVYSQLEVFTCSKSLSSLGELLSLCGGDLSSALPWLELHTLNFSYNSIVCLDQSLSLLNVLKSLDLSHNKIQECAEFLKPLSELEHLNLGYNRLQRAPSLGLGARAKLVTLILRNNELDTINGVEQLSSLQHLDLAYNLLMEHSQLAPLSLLHCLNTLILEGNPLYFQKNHRICTVQHLSPKTVHLRPKLDGFHLSSPELSVLPKPGQLNRSQFSALPPERSNQDMSSGAGELTDSVSVGEVAVSRISRKKSKGKVKVRRASITEPSDTDNEPRGFSSSMEIVLPHQQEIERMSSFRDLLGEDWLRYEHHLDGSAPSIMTAGVSDKLPAFPCPQALHEGLNILPGLPTGGGSQPVTSSVEVPGGLPPHPPLMSKDTIDVDADSTLQWSSQNTQHTESTLEDSVLNGQTDANVQVRSPASHSPKSEGGYSKEEEETDDLGVDLCLPLLVSVLPHSDDGTKDEKDERGREVFLRVKHHLLLEVDMQHGQERCRLELDSLTRVITSEAPWKRGENEEVLPVVELQFDYISKERQNRRYILLDDDPQQALKALQEILTRVIEENEHRESEFRPSCVRLQCLRCRSEFSLHEGPTDSEARQIVRSASCTTRVEGDSKEVTTEPDDIYKRKSSNCPKCSSDHVIQVVTQSSPSRSIPNQPYSQPDDRSEMTPSTGSSPKYNDSGANISSSYADATSVAEASGFYSAQETSFYIGDDPRIPGVSNYSTDCQNGEGLAGSYHYSTITSTPQVYYVGPSAAEDELDFMSDVYEVVDHRLKLFLDVEVFEEEDEEQLISFIKISAVKFGVQDEIPSVLVVSDKRVYILQMTSNDHKGQLSDWLQKTESIPVIKLSYLEVGLGSQSIHMEFNDGEVAYTLLVRDSARCRRLFGCLTGIVREMAHKSESKLKSISTTRLNPQHHLWPLVCGENQADVEEGQLQFFYILLYVLQGQFWESLTLLATTETLYLLKEDHHRRKSPKNLTVNDDKEPSSGAFSMRESLPVSCVSSINLFTSDPCRMEILLYDETEKKEKSWCVRSESSELLQGLVVWIRTQWEAMFGVKLDTSVRDQEK